MRKNVLVFALVALVVVVPMICFAEAMDQYAPDYQSSETQTLDAEITPSYTYTSSVTATLSFSNGTANCSGSVTPSGPDSVSLTVTLYQKNGSSWTAITSWSGSSTGGHQAATGGSVSVGTGTYKVTTVGNVGNGKETPTKSVTRTK